MDLLWGFSMTGIQLLSARGRRRAQKYYLCNPHPLLEKDIWRGWQWDEAEWFDPEKLKAESILIGLEYDKWNNELYIKEASCGE